MTAIVSDVHSRLNTTVVDDVVTADSLASIQTAIERATHDGKSLAVAGGRHAMGGQQFCSGGLLLDTTRMTRVLDFDRDRGLVEVEAGIQWPELLRFLHTEQRRAVAPWAFAQKQTGANRLSIGGAVSANVHGRGLSMHPFVSDVERLVVVGADGRVRRCSRTENPELFRLVVGGYGLFGVVYSATLRLVSRRKLERVVELETVDSLMERFDERIADGYLYGDFQFAIDPRSPDFLRRGVFSCYRPAPDSAPVPAEQARSLTHDDWKRLLRLAHVDKSRAFELYAAHYLSTSGQVYFSDAHQMAEYVDGYHGELDAALRAAHPASEMITELYVPRRRLSEFMGAAAECLRRREADLIYGTVRLIDRDEETFLPWARDRYACVIFNLHVEHTGAAIERAAEDFRALLDLAIERDGSFYLTYHRWASRAQVETCYPQFAEFLRLKREHDPRELLESDWYRHQRALFAPVAREAA